ncbi:hypothetical protein FQA47_004623 [Oryzias melastigma]|uniref:Uncharacterized protein n=1 Tax=Oryzias melastigma TaxID=30732 RepID=A0A834CRH6_ORYME|nr:hypothetical protein FQA47_004623 [Oryzias melastigma]
MWSRGGCWLDCICASELLSSSWLHREEGGAPSIITTGHRCFIVRLLLLLLLPLMQRSERKPQLIFNSSMDAFPSTSGTDSRWRPSVR